MSVIFEKCKKFSQDIFSKLTNEEKLKIYVVAEETQFVRFNQAKIRQPTQVEQIRFDCELVWNNLKKINFSFTVTDNNQKNVLEIFSDHLSNARKLIPSLPENSSVVELVVQKSFEEHIEQRPNYHQVIEETLKKFNGADASGIFTFGNMYRGFFNSKGCEHWYAKSLNMFDYSIYAGKQRAVKGTVSYGSWDQVDVNKHLDFSLKELEIMKKDWHILRPGKYRSYLAPEATAYLVGMLNWSGLSIQSYQQGMSCLKKMVDGKNWNSQFTLIDDLSSGGSPRFNDQGELADSKLTLIEKGKLKNFLVSSQSAKEYKVKSTFAEASEAIRCPNLMTGNIKDENILSTLDQGIYFSNLHYLNWSDLNNARVTGMSRFGCYWVENGAIISPIKEMRFDDELYHVFGKGLLGLTQSAKTMASTDTYFQRSTGLAKSPGMIIQDFTLTL